jgi:hypothetical protein
MLCAVLVSPAFAQAPTKPPASDTEAQPGHASVGSGNEVVSPNTKKNQNLSDHLANSGGVICPPPAVDPAIKAPTPETGNMPVIKPPGSPGGDQSVQPK